MLAVGIRRLQTGLVLLLVCTGSALSSESLSRPEVRLAFQRQYLHYVWYQELERKHQFIVDRFEHGWRQRNTVEFAWYSRQIPLVHEQRDLVKRIVDRLGNQSFVSQVTAEELAAIPADEQRELIAEAENSIVEEQARFESSAKNDHRAARYVYLWSLGALFMTNGDYTDDRYSVYDEKLTEITNAGYLQSRMTKLGTKRIPQSAGMLRDSNGWPLEVPVSANEMRIAKAKSDVVIASAYSDLVKYETVSQEMKAAFATQAKFATRAAVDVLALRYAAPILTRTYRWVLAPAGKWVYTRMLYPAVETTISRLDLRYFGQELSETTAAKWATGAYRRVTTPLASAATTVIDTFFDNRILTVFGDLSDGENMVRDVVLTVVGDELLDDVTIGLRAIFQGGTREEFPLPRLACASFFAIPVAAGPKVQALDVALNQATPVVVDPKGGAFEQCFTMLRAKIDDLRKRKDFEKAEILIASSAH